MKEFKAVGDEILARWSAASFDEERFPEIATEVMRGTALHERLDLEKVADWVFDSDELPPPSVSKTFSDAGFCVYYHSRFVIEMLTWVEASTAIHQHNFCGALQVLQGQSLHTTFAFTPEHRVSERLAFGKLERSELQTLNEGDVHPIAAGDAFIHRLFHLRRPSLSLVVRTFVQSSSPQYAYVEPGVRYDPFNRPAELEQQMKLLHVHERLGHPEYERRLCELVARLDPWAAFSVALTYGTVLYSRGTTERIRRVLDETFGAHGADVHAALVSAERFERIAMMRQRVREDDRRFFLAALLNAANKAELLAAVAHQYPEADPRELVIGWLRDMSGLAGFFEFDEAGIEFLGTAMRCNSFDETMSELAADCGTGHTFESRAELEDLDQGFRNSILEPLLT